MRVENKMNQPFALKMRHLHSVYLEEMYVIIFYYSEIMKVTMETKLTFTTYLKLLLKENIPFIIHTI